MLILLAVLCCCWQWSLNLILLLSLVHFRATTPHNIAVEKVGCTHHHFFSSISSSLHFIQPFVINLSRLFFLLIVLCCSPSILPSFNPPRIRFIIGSSNILSIVLFSLLVHWSLRLFLLSLLYSYCLFRFHNELQFWRRSQEERSTIHVPIKTAHITYIHTPIELFRVERVVALNVAVIYEIIMQKGNGNFFSPNVRINRFKWRVGERCHSFPTPKAFVIHLIRHPSLANRRATSAANRGSNVTYRVPPLPPPFLLSLSSIRGPEDNKKALQPFSYHPPIWSIQLVASRFHVWFSMRCTLSILSVSKDNGIAESK